MKYLYKLAFILVIGAGFALAQSGVGQGSQSTPSTPSSQQQPGAQLPDHSQMGQSGDAAAASTKAQSDVQSALRKQLPARAENVTVSVTDDNKVELSGMVSSESEKSQVEQIARSAAPNVEIVNKLTTGGSSTSPGSMPPASSQPPASAKPPRLQMIAYQQSPSGDPSSSQTSPSSQSPSTPGSASPAAGEQSGSMSSASASQDAAGSSDVQDKIQKAIQQDSSLSSANINVTVADNKVELTGTVASKDQKKTARQIAETNAAGMKVVDHLKVSASEATPSTPSTPPKN